MRRLVATALVVVVAAGAAALVLGSRAGAASDYRVDVIFDSARGVIPGQLVKVAGAPVGSIKDVKVTPGYRARIELEVDRRFAPFKADARCSIQPEGLIAEYFVQCDPGTAGARPLRAGDGTAADGSRGADDAARWA